MSEKIYKAKVIIYLESRNFPKLQEIAYRLYSFKLPKKENNPDDKENYISISSTQEDLSGDGEHG